MVDLFVFAFVQLSRFPDAKRGARFRVYFEYQKTKAERRRLLFQFSPQGGRKEI